MNDVREWQPGDIAQLVIQGEEVRGMASAEDATTVWRISGHSFFKSIGLRNDVLIQSARPLVVIDLADDALLERLASQLVYAGYTPDTGTVKAALRSLLEPPKPPRPVEPQGLGAVVEDSEGRLWVRASSDAGDDIPWRQDGIWRGWDEFDVARVLSEGLAS